MCRSVNVPMKNIGVSKAIWRELNKIRREQGFKYYTEAIKYLLKRPAAQQPVMLELESVSSFEEKKKFYSDGHTIGYKKGLNDGYNKGKSDWQIWYFCHLCNGRINISPDSNSHNAIIEYLKEHRWGHGKCPQQIEKEEVPPHSE